MGTALILDIFVNNILPILITAGAGFAMGRALRPDIKTATRLAFYVFSPSLVFTSLVHIGVTGTELQQLGLFTCAIAAVMAGLAFLTGRALHVERQLMATLIVASVFVNGGNYGLAATKFAFGEQALSRALVYFVFSTFILYTAGVLIASMGRLSWQQALRKLLTVPAFYALIAAGLVRMNEWQIPLFLERSVAILSDAAIPLMLVLLGLQIAEARTWPRTRLTLIGAASFLQLIMAPLAALLLAHWIGLSGPARQAAVLQSSMPTAVITTVLAIEYELDAQLMTGTVLVTTILSPLTLTPLIAYLLGS